MTPPRPKPWRVLRELTGRLIGRVVAVAVLLAVAQYVVLSDTRKQREHLRERVDTMHRQNLDLMARNAQLKLQIQAIQHDDQYLETVARHELGLVKEGEVVYRFLN